jgi:hypothetical protein
MKTFVIIAGEQNEASSVIGVFSTLKLAMEGVEYCKRDYFIKDAIWKKVDQEHCWEYGIDYIKIEIHFIDSIKLNTQTK